MTMPLSCDTTVVLSERTADRYTYLAKNSDRHTNESQRLIMTPRRSYPAGSTVRCQYLEIPQTPETFRLIGSQPYWLWGFEHGMNEYHVAIGNEAIHTKEPPQETGLLGMDLIRLGLERGRTAGEALRVITDLLERHGQGGSASAVETRYYDNAFIIADPTEAWILETAGRRWVAKKVAGTASISNQPTIEDAWDEASPDLIDYAIDQGWWPRERRDEFNFAKAYGDYVNHPTIGSHCRVMRARQVVGDRPVTRLQDLTALLRDHYEGTLIAPRWGPAVPDYPSICMHPTAHAPGGTAASMVAVLRPVGQLATYWGSFVTPCTGVFLPSYVAGDLPPQLGIAERDPDDASPWWQFKALQEASSPDYNALAPPIRQRWAAEEARLADAAVLIETRAQRLLDLDQPAEASSLLSRFMGENVARMMDLVSGLRAEVDIGRRVEILRYAQNDD